MGFGYVAHVALELQTLLLLPVQCWHFKYLPLAVDLILKSTIPFDLIFVFGTAYEQSSL